MHVTGADPVWQGALADQPVGPVPSTLDVRVEVAHQEEPEQSQARVVIERLERRALWQIALSIQSQFNRLGCACTVAVGSSGSPSEAPLHVLLWMAGEPDAAGLEALLRAALAELVRPPQVAPAVALPTTAGVGLDPNAPLTVIPGRLHGPGTEMAVEPPALPEGWPSTTPENMAPAAAPREGRAEAAETPPSTPSARRLRVRRGGDAPSAGSVARRRGAATTAAERATQAGAAPHQVSQPLRAAQPAAGSAHLPGGASVGPISADVASPQPPPAALRIDRTPPIMPWTQLPGPRATPARPAAAAGRVGPSTNPRVIHAPTVRQAWPAVPGGSRAKASAPSAVVTYRSPIRRG